MKMGASLSDRFDFVRPPPLAISDSPFRLSVNCVVSVARAMSASTMPSFSRSGRRPIETTVRSNGGRCYALSSPVLLHEGARLLPAGHESPGHAGPLLPAVFHRDELRHDGRDGGHPGQRRSESPERGEDHQQPSM